MMIVKLNKITIHDFLLDDNKKLFCTLSAHILFSLEKTKNLNKLLKF